MQNRKNGELNTSCEAHDSKLTSINEKKMPPNKKKTQKKNEHQKKIKIKTHKNIPSKATRESRRSSPEN
jgi:hypothetical protein